MGEGTEELERHPCHRKTGKRQQCNYAVLLYIRIAITSDKNQHE